MKLLIITDSDLDGAGAALHIKWVFPKAKIDIVEIVADKYFDSVVRGLKLDKYDRIFITDLTIPDSLLELLDIPKVTILDHHLSHIEVRDRYKQAAVYLGEETSTVKLLKYCIPNDKMTAEQLQLMDIIDDYDQYSLKYPDSLKLNSIFQSLNRPKVNKFVEMFSNGFRPYNNLEQGMINIYFKRFKEQLENIQFYRGVINDKVWVSFMCQSSPNELAQYALRKYGADICLIVYPQFETVSLRKRKDCDTPLHRLAEVLCDGGGHAYAAGGQLTGRVKQLTTKLQPC